MVVMMIMVVVMGMIVMMIVGMPMDKRLVMPVIWPTRPFMLRIAQMKTQQINAVVIAIWRAHSGVNVEPFRFGIVQHDAPMVIKFDHRDGALDAIVKHALLFQTPGPAKLGCRFMRL